MNFPDINLAPLQEALNYPFTRLEWLQEALIHPSYSQEKDKDRRRDNQRLEFLGDAVLQLVVTEMLYQKYPQLPEGALTQMRARLVRRPSLACLAKQLELGKYLALGKGEEKNNGRTRPSNLADAFEAVLGAIHCDSGWDSSKAITENLMLPVIESLEPNIQAGNPKGMLQERLQSEGGAPPSYQLESATGPAHTRDYQVSVHWQGQELAQGKGKSKKEAEVNAAAAALVAYKSFESNAEHHDTEQKKTPDP